MSRFRGPCRVPGHALRARGKLALPGVASPLAALLGTWVTIAMPIATASTADAATYSVWACANGSGAPLGVGSWVRSAGATGIQTTCGEPSVPVGALYARARAVSADAPGGGGWVVAAAKGTRITSLDVWWTWQVTSGGAIRVYALGNAFLDPTGVPDPFDGKGRCCSDSAFVNLKAGAFGMPTTTSPGVALAQLNQQSFPKLRASTDVASRSPAWGLYA